MVKCVKLKDIRSVRGIFGKNEVQAFVGKDQDGSTEISVWKGCQKFNNLEEGEVYVLKDLMVSKFPENKPHFFATTRSTQIEGKYYSYSNLLNRIFIIC